MPVANNGRPFGFQGIEKSKITDMPEPTVTLKDGSDIENPLALVESWG